MAPKRRKREQRDAASFSMLSQNERTKETSWFAMPASKSDLCQPDNLSCSLIFMVGKSNLALSSSNCRPISLQYLNLRMKTFSCLATQIWVPTSPRRKCNRNYGSRNQYIVRPSKCLVYKPMLSQAFELFSYDDKTLVPQVNPGQNVIQVS